MVMTEAKQRWADSHVEQRRIANRKQYQMRRDLVDAAKSKPCTDCGGEFPTYVMDLDHLGDKEFGISDNLTHVSMTRLAAEIAKCEPVCANCHRIRTHRRRMN